MDDPNQTTPAGASTAAPAAPERPVAPAEPTPPPQTLTSRLFPDFVSDDGTIMPGPIGQTVLKQPAAGEATSQNPSPSVATPSPQPAAPKPEYLEMSSLQGKLVRVKVDGVESDVPAEDLVKNFQLESHLTVKGQRLAEQEKSLKAIRDDLLRKAAPPRTENGQPPAETPDDEPKNPQLAALEKKLADTQAQLQEVMSVTAEVRLNRGLETIDQRIRQTTGATDFMAYLPKVKAHIKTFFVNPEQPTNEELNRYDNVATVETVYKDLKLKDMLAGNAPPAPSLPPAPSTQAPKPPATPNPERRAEPVFVEPAGGNPPRSLVSENWASQYQVALEKATQSGNDEDWLAVIRLKNQKPPA